MRLGEGRKVRTVRKKTCSAELKFFDGLLQMSDFEDNTSIPNNFPDLESRGKTFLWMFANRKEFVKFCVEEMVNTSGLFKLLQEYFCRKIKKCDEKVPRINSTA